MLGKTVITAYLVVMILCGFTVFSDACNQGHGKTLFNGHIGKDKYKLMGSSSATEPGIKSSSRYEFLPDELKRSLRSRRIISISEQWINDSGILRIDSYQFEYAKDAVIYPSTLWGPFGTGFETWDKNPAVGDQSCWITPYILLFAKDKMLVRIYLNSGLTEMNEQKAFVKKVAEQIVKKISSEDYTH